MSAAREAAQALLEEYDRTIILRERERIAAYLRSMAEPWGNGAAWMTTGKHVAELVAKVVESMACGADMGEGHWCLLDAGHAGAHS